ncbi:MAG: DUF1761 domain-containing protein [Candidatus Dadabacteria bacterium]
MDTSFLSQLNWLHVLVAAIAYFALGAIWYSALFQKQWVKYHGVEMNAPDAKKGVAAIMIGSFVWMFIVSIGIAIIVHRLGLNNVLSGIKWGFFTGFCFSTAAISITYLYLKKPAGLHFIDGLYHIVGQIIVAVILCAW